MEVMNRMTVQDVAPGVANIITIDSDVTVPHALRTLIKHNILCAPVKDSKTQEVIGLLDMVDVVSYIVEIFTETEIMGEGFLSVLENGERFVTSKVETLMDRSKRNPFCPVAFDAPLLEVVQLLSTYGIHRVPVIQNGKLVNMVTQSALVRWLATHIKELGPLAEKTIEQLGIATPNVVTINIKERAIDAFRLMYQKRVSGVAVVGDSGMLIANVSVRDIRAIAYDARVIQRLYVPLAQFLPKMHENEINVRNPSICCRPNTTLKEVVQRLSLSRVHRIYVVDESHHLKGVVSLTDVLKALLPPKTD